MGRLALGIDLMVTFEIDVNPLITWTLTIMLFFSEILPSFMLVFSYLIFKGPAKEGFPSVEKTDDFTLGNDSIKDIDIFDRNDHTQYMLKDKNSAINKSKIENGNDESSNSQQEKFVVNLSKTQEVPLMGVRMQSNAIKFDSEDDYSERGEEMDPSMRGSARNSNHSKSLLNSFQYCCYKVLTFFFR